jgi:hypothetical protein
VQKTEPASCRFCFLFKQSTRVFYSTIILTQVIVINAGMIDPQHLKTLTQLLKYAGLVLTSTISLHSLSRETYDKTTKSLTKAGKRHAILLLVSGFIALAGSILENRADNALKKIASAEGDKRFQQALQDANAALVNDIKPQFGTLLAHQQVGMTKSTDEINRATSVLTKNIDAAVPLGDLSFHVTLSNFVKMELEARQETSHEQIVHFIGDHINATDWNAIVCSGVRHEHPWSMKVPITSSVRAIVGYTLKEEALLPRYCDIPSYGVVELLVAPDFRFSVTSTSLGGDTNIHIYGNLDMSELPQQLRWHFNASSLNVLDDDPRVEVHTTTYPIQILMPRKITVELSAYFEGLPTRKSKLEYVLAPKPGYGREGGLYEETRWFAVFKYSRPGKQSRSRFIISH